MAPRSTDSAWQPRAAWDRVDLLTLSRRSDEELSAALSGSPMRRTKLQGLRRNIAVAVANTAAGSDTASDTGSDTVSDPVSDPGSDTVSRTAD